MRELQSLCVVLVFIATRVACFVFDAEEIKSLNYAIEILDQPVIINDDEDADPLTVRMLNKHGQPYACRLPTPSPPPEAPSANPEVPEATPSELIKPLGHGPCLQRTKGWWTYELCPMHNVRQFHLEGGQIVGRVTGLGEYESDYDWSGDDGRSRNAKQRYHSQQYTNGTDCDLTGRPRSTEVRYICEEGAEDSLIRVDEPETCRYVVSVHTARLCKHRQLAPPVQQRPLTLSCRPQLTQQQLHLLTDAQRRRSQAQRARGEQETPQGDENRRPEVAGIETMDDGDELLRDIESGYFMSGGGNNAVGGDLGDEEEAVMRDAVADETAEEEERWRVAEAEQQVRKLKHWLSRQRDVSDLHELKHTRQLFEAIEAQTQRLGDVLGDVIHGYSGVVTDVGADADRLRALGMLHRSAREQQASRGAHIRELLAATEAGKYSPEIIRELLRYTDTLNIFSQITVSLIEELGRVQEAVRRAPGRLGPSSLLKLARSVAELHSLSDKLQSFFSETDEVRSALMAMSDLHPDLDGDSDEDDDEVDDDDKEHDASEKAFATSKQPGSAHDPDIEENQVAPERDGDSAAPSDTGDERGEARQAPAEQDDDSAVPSDTGDETEPIDGQRRLRDKRKGAMKLSTLQTLGLDRMVQVSSIERAQRQRIEKAVKQKLAKIGLDSNGPEIKVRFLKYPDFTDLEKEHTLSEEEMTAFENALVTIMVGGQQALTEHDRQQQLERNYQYSFDEALKSAEEPANEEQRMRDKQAEDLDTMFTLV